ncbi:MAG: hypothetical protein MUF83_09370 [Acidimicrobiales bacterium]|jgi:hypothetical protein|nr:hypothetical protein [Acidimicrobiales bacterium]
MAGRTALHEQLRAQQAQLDELRAEVTELRTLTGATSPPTRGEDPDVGTTSVPAAGAATTDRRHLLTTAATLAAGAVVGGTALAVAAAPPAAAAAGTFDGDPAVSAVADPTTGTGVRGTSGSGYALYGFSNTGYGLYAQSNTRSAVWAYAPSGAAVQATTAGTGASNLFLSTSGVAPPPPPTSTSGRSAGTVVRDSNGDVWFCVATGTPGTWRKLSGPATAGVLHVLATPVRVYDSRPGFAPAFGIKAPLTAGVARDCDLKANGSGVPAGATAVLVSLVATGTTGDAGGFLAIYRNGLAWPGTSNLNWSGPGQNVAVTTLTAVDGSAICKLYANVVTHVVVDVLGYYR